ncbi:MAG: hypothetical protein RJB62_1996 [Pseudomonadota bacterium]
MARSISGLSAFVPVPSLAGDAALGNGSSDSLDTEGLVPVPVPAALPQYEVMFEPVSRGETEVDAASIHWLLDGAPQAPGVRVLRQSFSVGDEAVSYRLWYPSALPHAFAVLLHGACDYSAAFEELGTALAASGIAALAYDQNGCGTRRSRGISLYPAHQISDLLAASDALRAKAYEIYGSAAVDQPLFLIGESMGGGVAVRGAAAGIDIAGLVLVAPAAIACPYRRVFFQAAANLVAFFAPWSRWRIERRGEAELSDLAAIRFLSDPFVLRRVPSRMMAQLFALAAEAARVAPRVTVPTLTLVGTGENILRRECIETLHRRLSGPAEIEVLEGAGHFLLHAKRNSEIFRRIADWILARAA